MKRIVSAVLISAFLLSSCRISDTVSDISDIPSADVLPDTSAANEKTEIKKSEYTDLFYGRSLLPDNLKKAYDTIAFFLREMSPTVPVLSFSMSESDVQKVVGYVLHDDPYLFHVKNNYTVTVTNDRVSEIEFEYLADKAEYADMCAGLDRECDKTVSALSGKSDFEKCIGIHDALCRCVTYKKGDFAYDAYGALVKGEAVCQGYTEAGILLLYKLSVPAVFVEGKFGGESHSWIMAKADGEWYHMDITADDPENSEEGEAVFHTFAMITDEEMKGSHSFTGYPEANAKKGNYYVVKNLYMAEFSKDTLCGLIIDCKKSGVRYLSVRFGTKEALDTAKIRFSSGDLGKGIKALYGESIPLSSVSLGMNYGIYDITFKIE